MILGRVRDGAGQVWAGRVEDDHLVPLAEGEGLTGQRALLTLAMGRGEAGHRRPVAESLALDDVQVLTPIPEPPSIRDFYAFEAHVKTAREGRGMAMDPDWYELPVFYFTNPGAVIGPGDPVHAPRGSAALDYELEVAAVIGPACIDLDADDPTTLDMIAGFTIMNDWSARDLQRREMAQMLGPAKGKDFATSLGPWLVTPDELPGFATGRPRARMQALVNGEGWSDGDLGDLHFPWGRLLAHASADARLRPGDVIGSGTVGTGCILELQLTHGAEHRPWLRPGDAVELVVEHLGALGNPVTPRDPYSPPP